MLGRGRGWGRGGGGGPPPAAGPEAPPEILTRDQMRALSWAAQTHPDVFEQFLRPSVDRETHLHRRHREAAPFGVDGGAPNSVFNTANPEDIARILRETTAQGRFGEGGFHGEHGTERIGLYRPAAEETYGTSRSFARYGIGRRDGRVFLYQGHPANPGADLPHPMEAMDEVAARPLLTAMGFPTPTPAVLRDAALAAAAADTQHAGARVWATPAARAAQAAAAARGEARRDELFPTLGGARPGAPQPKAKGAWGRPAAPPPPPPPHRRGGRIRVIRSDPNEYIKIFDEFLRSGEHLDRSRFL